MKLIRPIGSIELIRLISLIGLIALTLTACSGSGEGGDDLLVTDVEELTPISFSCGLAESETVTRAGTPLSDANVTAFTVWGYKNMAYDDVSGSYDKDGTTLQKVFPGFLVKWVANSAATTTTNTNGWEYLLTEKPDQTIKYWDWSAKAYRFYGATGEEATDAADLAAHPEKFLPNASSTELTFQADASPVMKTVDEREVFDKENTDIKLAATPYFTHLWFSTGSLENYPDKQFGKPVTLEFLKPYARVRFMFKYVYPREGIDLANKSFKPANDDDIIRKGTVTISYPLTGKSTSESFTMIPNDSDDPAVNKALDAFTEDYDPEDDTKDYIVTDNGWYTVLPNNTQGSYTLTVSINGGDTKYVVVPAEYMQWKPGYSYTYIFKVTDKGGVEIGWVEYAVTPWTELRIDRKVYNW